MNGDAIALIVIVIGQAGLIWYKLGKCEEKILTNSRLIKKMTGEPEEAVNE